MYQIGERSSTLDKFIVDLNKYQTVKKIKSGGFGSVHLIKDKNTKNKFAAKIIELDEASKDKNKKMINREIGIMIRLQHPTIIKFYGFSLTDFEGQENVTIIMDYAENGSLATVLLSVQKGLSDIKYDNTARQKILIGIARGMMHLHQNRIIHRDLKPDNVLLDNQYHPHITDFGLSKITYSQSQNQTESCGTTIYMAPEVINGYHYNWKADVYSFAILMYEVLTDTIPYPLLKNGQMTPFQFSEKVVRENYRPEFNLPIKDSLKKLICQCWSSDPNERPTFEDIFNRLAFNIEDSVYDVFADEDEFKYYIDGADPEEVLDYAYSIAESDNQVSANSEIEKALKKHNELINELMKDQVEIKKELKASLETIDALSKENDQLKKDNIEIKKELKANVKTIDALSKDNDQLKIDNEKLKKDNIEIKKELKASLETIDALSLDDSQLSNDIDQLMGGNIEIIKELNINMKTIDALSRDNVKLKSDIALLKEGKFRNEEKDDEISDAAEEYRFSESDGTILCPHCGRRLSPKSAQRHISLCKKMHGDRAKARDQPKHSQNNLNNQESDDHIKCPHCGRMFSPEDAQKHIPACGRMHKLRDKVRNKPKPSPNNLDHPESDDRIKCQYCGLMFLPEAAQRHIPVCERINRIRDKARNKPKPSPNNLDHPESNDRIKCPHCGRMFLPEAAQRHIPVCGRINRK